MDPWNVDSVSSLAALSDLLRTVSDEQHPGYARAVSDVAQHLAKYTATLLTSLESVLKSATLDRSLQPGDADQENVDNKADNNASNNLEAIADELVLLFHRMDVLFLLLYTDRLASKQRAYEVLCLCFFGSSLPAHDRQLANHLDWFDSLKRVRKGIFVLGQAMSVLLGSDMPATDSGPMDGGSVDSDPVDGTNALFVLSSALHRRDQGEGEGDQMVARSLPLALEWMIDILESPFGGPSPDHYPNAVGVRSVMRDLVFKVLFYYERFDAKVTGLVCRALSRCHRHSVQLCDSLWTSEDRDVLIAFVTSCLVSDDLPFFLDDPLVDLLASLSCGSIGAAQVGQLLLCIPMLSAPRSPDRHWVEESFSSADNRILLVVEKRGGLRLSVAGVGVILPEGTTGSQREQETSVLWNVPFSAYEFMYRLLESDRQSAIVPLLASLLSNGFPIPAPQIEPLFEVAKVEGSLFGTFAGILRQSLDQGCSPSLLVDLLKCLRHTCCDGDGVLLAELDLLSDTPRGLFHALSGTNVHDEEQASVLVAFFDLLAKCAGSVPRERVLVFLEGCLASTRDYPEAFLASLGQLLANGLILDEASRVQLRRHDLLAAFIRCIPSCVAGARALLGSDTPLDKGQVEGIVDNLPSTSTLLADILKLSLPITLDSRCYSTLARLADDEVLDAIGGMSNKDRQRHHLTQLRALGLVDRMIARTDSVLFMHACGCADKQVIAERAIPKLGPTASMEENKAILELAMDNAIDIDLAAVLESAPELADVVIHKRIDACTVAVVLRNAKALVSISVTDAFLSHLATIPVDHQILACLKQCSSLPVLQTIIPHFPDSDLFLELVEEEPLIVTASLKVATSGLLGEHLRVRGLLHFFFTRSSLSDPRLVQLLSKHRVVARELTLMGLLEAVENCPARQPSILFDAMLACLDDSSSADRIAALLKMQIDSSNSPSSLLADVKVLELMVKLQRSSSLKAQHWVRSLGDAVLAQVVAAYAADVDAIDERTCMLALTFVQESGRQLTDALLGRLVASGGAVGEFVKLLFN